MSFPKQQAHLDALEKRIELLAAALRRRDDDAAWEHVRDALSWLYRSEEAARKAIRDYYSIRSEEVSGQTLAGLIWVRGLVDHHGAEVRAVMWVPSKTFVRVGGEWRPSKPKVWVNGQWVETKTMVAQVGWPLLADLPAGKPEHHGRDGFYGAHVASKRPVAPLRVARDFLGSL